MSPVTWTHGDSCRDPTSGGSSTRLHFVYLVLPTAIGMLGNSRGVACPFAAGKAR